MLSLLHTGHFVDYGKIPQRGIEGLISKKTTNNFGVLHIIGEGCNCSQLVGEYLMKRGPEKQYYEEVILIGNFKKLAKQLKEKGFAVKQTPLEDLIYKKIDLSGVPFFMLYDQKGVVQLISGYSNQLINPFTTQFKDKELVSAFFKEKKDKPLPIFGCAVSKEYQKLLDPLGLKYKKEVAHERKPSQL